MLKRLHVTTMQQISDLRLPRGWYSIQIKGKGWVMQATDLHLRADVSMQEGPCCLQWPPHCSWQFYKKELVQLLRFVFVETNRYICQKAHQAWDLHATIGPVSLQTSLQHKRACHSLRQSEQAQVCNGYQVLQHDLRHLVRAIHRSLTCIVVIDWQSSTTTRPSILKVQTPYSNCTKHD